MILRQFPPMGVYETLFRFASTTGTYMGEPGTHPWAQGFPLTTPVPGGPELPSSIAITATDRMYPKADGQPALRAAIAAYYRRFYDARSEEHTSELQSQSNLVCRLLLEKKKNR